jgi:hypothetical protein
VVSPALCPTLSTALKSKFFPLPMVIAAGIGLMNRPGFTGEILVQ